MATETVGSQYPFPGLNVNNSLLPLFIAHCLNWALFGLLCLQIYAYYVSFPRDRAHFKGLVYGVFLMDTTSLALATYSGYVVFVQHWGDVEVFDHLGWSWASVPISSGVVAFVVQSFFAYRIWIISSNFLMACFVVLLSATACGFAIASGVEVARLQTFSYIRRMIPSVWLCFGIAADFFICATLVFYLLRTPSRFKPSRRIIIRLVRISIETAVVTMVAALIKLVLIYSRHDLMHILFCLLLPRLYTNAMVGTLNSRSPVFGGGQSFRGSGTGTGSAISDTPHTGLSYSTNSTGPGSVRKSIVKFSHKISDEETGYDDQTIDDGQELTYDPNKLHPQSYPLSPARHDAMSPLSASETLLAQPISPPPDAHRRF